MKFNFEKELQDWTAFYEKHNIHLAPNFAKKMQDIWDRNLGAIEEAVKEKGFDKVVFIPEELLGMRINDLEAEMTKGYEKEKGNKTIWEIEPSYIVNYRLGGRIILVHSAPDVTAHPELQKTLGGKCGDEKMTLFEWLVLQRQIWETTGVHIDGKVSSDTGYTYTTWLPGSMVGENVVWVNWDDKRALVRIAYSWIELPESDRGCRLSRSFR